MFAWLVSVVFLVPVAGYWVNRRSERRHYRQRLQIIDRRLRQLEKRRVRAANEPGACAEASAVEKADGRG